MPRLSAILFLVIFLSFNAAAQKPEKPWVEWSLKEAQKILDDSPWGRTQTETDTSEMFYSPTATPVTASANATTQDRAAQGATNQATSVKFRIRFFTAKPIRQAFVRLLESQNQLDKARTEKMRAWADLHTDEYIIVAVSYEATDRRYLGRVDQAFESAVTAVLKDSTYLERRDGKRLFLSEYKPPKKDGLGAHFIFPRILDGQPFLTADSGSIRFHSEYQNQSALDPALTTNGQSSRTGNTRQSSSSIQPGSPFKFKLDMRFKVSEMMYGGVLEY
jgi:hypothetical protein